MKTEGWHIALPGGAPMPAFHRTTREDAIDAFTRAKRLKWKAAYMRGYRCQQGHPAAQNLPLPAAPVG